MDDDMRRRYRRDYTGEMIKPPRPQAAAQPGRPAPNPSIPPAHHPSPGHHAAAHPPVKSRRRRRPLIAALLVLLIAAAGGGGYWYRSNRLASPVPDDVRASVNFPILYPSQLPSGYRLDDSSFSTSGGVVLYSAVNPAGTKIAFTDQQRPSNFNFNNFYKQGLSNSTTFDTPLGQAALGTANGRPLGSLVSDNSWVLVSSASKSVQSDDLRLVLNSLKVSSR